VGAGSDTLDAARLPPLRDAYLVTLDHLVGFAGRGLLAPVLF